MTKPSRAPNTTASVTISTGTPVRSRCAAHSEPRKMETMNDQQRTTTNAPPTTVARSPTVTPPKGGDDVQHDEEQQHGEAC